MLSASPIRSSLAARNSSTRETTREMTDFYTLLKQSLIDRGIKNPKDREEVYAQARRAVIKQLWDFRPPLAADEIDTRVGAYDTAVERIESDLQEAFAGGANLPAVARKPRLPVPQEAAPNRNDQDSSPPLVGWAHEEAAYERGIPRATPDYSSREEPEEQDRAYEDEPPAYEADSAYEPAERRADRWSDPHAYESDAIDRAERRRWFEWLGTGDQRKVRLLAITIGGLFVVLVGISATYLARRGDDGVTLAIGVRREVSDAATAARIAAESVQVSQSFAVFDGKDPTIFATTPDNPIRFDSANGFARISSSTGAPGVKVLIGPGLASRLAGKQVRVVITARSSLEVGAAGMRFAYQSGLAISHWQTANLSSDYEPVGMLWRVPTMRTSPAGDFLLIEPGIPGDGTGADIESIRIDVLAS